MAGHSKVAKSTGKRKRSTRKKSNKALMRDLRSRANLEALDLNTDRFREISPETALQECLDRAFAYLRFYASEADKLPADKIWRDTIAGRIPHEAIRAEKDMRAEVAYLAGRALDIGLETRKVQLGERAADMLTDFIESVMEEVGLNAEQRRKLGPAIRHHLPVVEGTTTTPSPAALPAGRKAA